MSLNQAVNQENGMGGIMCKKVNSATAVTIMPTDGKVIIGITCCGETVISAAVAAPGYEIEDLPDTYPLGIELVPRLSSVTLTGFATIYIGY